MSKPEPYTLTKEQHELLKKTAENTVTHALRGVGSSFEKFDIVSRWILAGSVFIVYNTLTSATNIPAIYSPFSFKVLLVLQLASIAFGVIYIGISEMIKSARSEVAPYLEKDVARVVEVIVKEIENSGKEISSATTEDLIISELTHLTKKLWKQKTFLFQLVSFIVSFLPVIVQFLYNY